MLRHIRVLLISCLLSAVVQTGCDSPIRVGPNDIPPEWIAKLDAAMMQSITFWQGEGQLPSTACEGAIIGQGLRCPSAQVSNLDAIASTREVPCEVELDTKYAKGTLRFTQEVRMWSTSNESVQHDHRCFSELAQECAPEFVSWRVVVNVRISIRNRATLDSQVIELDVDLGEHGSMDNLTYCKREPHADPRKCGPNRDCCTGTEWVMGPGPFNFDLSEATTGTEGQNNPSCSSPSGTGIENDVWYVWTPDTSGRATLTTCGQTSVDTKIAVYVGSGCPTADAIACNDDSCGPQSSVCFDVLAGQPYTIQIGTSPNATPGAGSFLISISGVGGDCQLDDGSSETLIGFTGGGGLAWIQGFGGDGSTSLDDVQVAWGSAAYPGSSPGNGSPATLLVYDDPDDDGDPTDAVLVEQIATWVQNVDTDVFNTVPITPVVLHGRFFIGASLVHSPGQYVAPVDRTGCVAPNGSWVFGNESWTSVDFVNPSSNQYPPQSLDSLGYPGNLMIRAGCDSTPMTSFCLPGQDGVIPCPCANPPFPPGSATGCDNFVPPAGGAALSASGIARISNDTLAVTMAGGVGTSVTVLFQGTTNTSNTRTGAGVRCVAGSLKRLYRGNPVGGTIQFPNNGMPVHLQSQAKGYTIVAPITLYYYCAYRNSAANGQPGCPGLTFGFNSTNAGAIAWSP